MQSRRRKKVPFLMQPVRLCLFFLFNITILRWLHNMLIRLAACFMTADDFQPQISTLIQYGWPCYKNGPKLLRVCTAKETVAHVL